MSYFLGVDLGTTWTAAATNRDGRLDVVTLGNRTASIPSVVYLREDGELLVGEPAERRAVTEALRVTREFKRRVGDPTPILVGGTPYAAENLMAKLLRWVVDAVIEREGEPPERIAISHPANWGPFKTDLLAQAVRLADLPGAALLSEPEAAAIHYAANERVEPGETIAVYDLGGGTFDAAVLSRTADGWRLEGDPEGIERLGGIDIDEAVFALVTNSLGGALESLPADDPTTRAAVARLRQDCVAAKEALSTDTDAVVPVLLPNIQTEVRITRAELENLIRPTIVDTIGALQRALRNADTAPDDLRAVLLVGGSSRIPLISAMVTAELGRPVAVDTHPKHAVALGAALAAAGDTAAADAPAATAVPPVAPVGEADVPDATRPTEQLGSIDESADEPTAPQPAMSGTGPPGGPPPITPASDDRSRPRSRLPLVAGVAVAVLAIIGIGIAAAGGGDGDDGAAIDSSETTSVEDRTASDGETTTSTSTSTTTTTTIPEGRFVQITEITLSEGDTEQYVVDYETFDFTPRISNDPDDRHIHFFFDTVPPLEAGTNEGSDDWILYDGPKPFTGYSVADRDSQYPGATQMCALVADVNHAIEVGTGNCVDLPT